MAAFVEAKYHCSNFFTVLTLLISCLLAINGTCCCFQDIFRALALGARAILIGRSADKLFFLLR